MLQNAYFLAKIGADTAENEQHFAEILPKIGNYPTGPPTAVSDGSAPASSAPTSGGGGARRACGEPDSSRAPGHDGRSAKFRQNVARFRLYRHRFLQVNMRLSAFFKIYQIFKLTFLKFGNILQILRHLRNFCWIFTKIAVFSNRFFAKILRLQRCKSMQIL